MNRNPTLAFTALVSLALLPHGAALHCNGEITTITTPGATLYMDDRSSGSGDINHWFYLESNGREGLQSGHDSWVCDKGVLNCLVVSIDDHCYHHDPDIFVL